jgi:hypothetical protein
MIRHNSLGKLIHPTEAGIVNFWRWFGDSKVTTITKQGPVPLVVYHGTNAKFNQFSDKDFGATVAKRGVQAPKHTTGFFFSPDEETAKYFGHNVMPVYLKMENPYEYDLEPGDLGQVKIEAELMLAAKDEGCDGVWLYDEDSGETYYIVFDPTQIKSAIGNRGTFDPSDPVITNPPTKLTSITLEAPSGLATRRYGRVSKTKVLCTARESDGYQWGLARRSKLTYAEANQQIKACKTKGWKVVQRHRQGE